MSDKVCCPTDKGPAKVSYTPTGGQFYITGSLNAKAGIVFVGDIFGVLANTKRSADALAAQGFLVVVPDFFAEGAWEESNWPPNYESSEWQAFYGLITDMEHHAPLARRGVELLRQLGCTKVATIGTCWGTRVALMMGAEGLADAVATTHPSFLMPENVESVKDIPTLILPSREEGPMPEIEAVLNKNTAFHVFKCYDKLPHGFFANRYDWDNWDAEQRAQMKDAEATVFDFFKKVLAP